jgi:hypothetical protein
MSGASNMLGEFSPKLILSSGPAAQFLVPEPGTMAMLAAGSMLGLRRRRA